MLEEYRFSLQFNVNSQQMFNMCVKDVSLFKKDDYDENKEMLIKPIKHTPDEQKIHVLNIYSTPVIEKIRILLVKIDEDKSVKKYVKFVLNMIINEIGFINRVRMERLITIAKVGIPGNCKIETLYALVDLEYIVNVLYSPDYKNYKESERFDFRKQICQLDAADGDYMEKFLSRLNLDTNLCDKFISLINRTEITDPKQCLTIIMKYMTSDKIIETFISSVDSIKRIVDCVNVKLDDFPLFDKRIIISSIGISLILRNDELYVDFYGYIDEYICGSFSLDFRKLRNMIKEHFPYYIFYLVTCCYCYLYETNVFRVKINEPNLNNMFVFFNEDYYRRIKLRVDHFEQGFNYEAPFNHLKRFFQTIGFE